MKNIVIKSFFGIGDMLFATPSFPVIKKAYPHCHLVVNTSHPTLLENNPWVDEIGTKDEGVLLLYTAPDSGRLPTKHHIIEDWEIICKAYDLQTEIPQIKPEIYVPTQSPKKDFVGVQVVHRRNYHGKRVWPWCKVLASRPGFRPIPYFQEGNKERQLVEFVASCRAIVCSEGGISHIAEAVGTPAIVLMGGFTRPQWVGYSDQVSLTCDYECSPCYNCSPCKRNFRCWHQLPLEMVEKLALQKANESIFHDGISL